MRVILYTGKGGVGKTTVAAATAVKCAEMGLKTLVMSTDAAHSLGDSLDRELAPEPVEVAENLFGQEVNACLLYTSPNCALMGGAVAIPGALRDFGP